MAAHRRSLSHVEYDAEAESTLLRRRKRKDKTRRNTIAGDGTGEIKKAVDEKAKETEDTRPVILRNTPLRASITARIKERLGLKKPSRPVTKPKPLSLSQNYLADTSLTDDTNTTFNTDRLSHASESDINLESHFRRALSADRQLDSIKRRFGPLQTFVTDHEKDGSPDQPMMESLYEMIGEKEFGTLGASLRRMPKRPKIAHIPGVRLRELSKEEGCRSSSGNWSGSTSTRASMDSASVSPAPNLPKRSTSSTSLDCDSLLSSSSRSTCPNTSGGKLEPRLVQAVPPHLRSQSRWKGGNLDTSTSSQASEGTITPEIRDDTSSVYSCDAEGYYTSFQFDSGLKGTGAETDYDLFGQGSTSTTTSSVGTVIARELTIKEAPPPPPRGSTLRNRDSIITVIDVSMQQEVEVTIHEEPKRKSPEPADFSSESESERTFKFREKTCMSSSRIPSMCAITPPGSDDESEKSDQKSEPCNIENSLKRQEKLESQIQAVFLHHFDSQESPPSVKLPTLQDLNESSTMLTKAVVENKSETVVFQNSESKLNGDLLSLSELPNIIPATPFTAENDSSSSRSSSLERKRGARVTLDSEGRVVYSSDSLKRRKGANTTFEPGVCVKEKTPVKARTMAVVHMMDSVGQGLQAPVVQLLENLRNVQVRRSLSPSAEKVPTQRRSVSPARVTVKDRCANSPVSDQVDSAKLVPSLDKCMPKTDCPGSYSSDKSNAMKGGLKSVSLVQSAVAASIKHQEILSPSSYKENLSLNSSHRLRANSYLHANGELTTPRSSVVHRADSYKQANSSLSTARQETKLIGAAVPSSHKFQVKTPSPEPNGYKRVPLTARTMNESTMKRLEKLNSVSTDPKEVQTPSSTNPNVLGRRSYGPRVMVDRRQINGVKASPIVTSTPVRADSLFRPIRPPVFSTEKPSFLSSDSESTTSFPRHDTRYHSLPSRIQREAKSSTPVFDPSGHSSPRRVHFADDRSPTTPQDRVLPPYTPPPAYNGALSPVNISRLNKSLSPISTRRAMVSPSPSVASSCSLDMSFASSEGYERSDLNQLTLDGSWNGYPQRFRGYGDSSGSGSSPTNSFSSLGRSRSTTPEGRGATSPVSPTKQTPLHEFKKMISEQNKSKPKVSAAELLGVGRPVIKTTPMPKAVEPKRQYGRLSPWKGGRRAIGRGDISIPTIPEGNSEEESEESDPSSKEMIVKRVTSPGKSEIRSSVGSVTKQLLRNQYLDARPSHPPIETAL